MPRSKPTPEELERGAAELIDLVTTLLTQLRQAQAELIEAGLHVGMTWSEIAHATGKRSGDAARQAHKAWRSGRA